MIVKALKRGLRSACVDGRDMRLERRRRFCWAVERAIGSKRMHSPGKDVLGCLKRDTARVVENSVCMGCRWQAGRDARS